MRNIFNKIFIGETRVKIEGLNLGKLTAELVAAGIELYDYEKPNNKTLLLSVENSARKKLIAICQKLCYNFSVVRENGASVLFKSMRFRLGLTVGLIALIVAVALFNSFIWAINVTGTERLLQSDVLRVLSEQGIKKGIFRGKIDGKVLSDFITSEFPDASMVYVKVKGTTLNVQIVETLYHDDVIDRDVATDITAPHEGRVDKITAFAGTPLVKAGDVVKAGQILIANYEDKLLDDGITVERVFKKALGSVEMTVWYTHEEVFAETAVNYMRTGNTAQTSELRIFGKAFAKRGSNPFLLSESVSETHVLFKNNGLPFKRYVTTYYELEKKEETRSFADFENSLKLQALAEARLKAPQDAEIFDEYTHIAGTAGIYRVTGVAATKIKIGG